jgi:pterin-4a-carbinolamine dehydratase
MENPREVKKVIALTAEDTPLTEEMVKSQLEYLSNWKVDRSEEGFQLKRFYEFPDFQQATQFVYEIGKRLCGAKLLPRIELIENVVSVAWLSPEARGLHPMDFIMAATTDEVFGDWATITGVRDKVDEASEESFPASDPPAVGGDASQPSS